MWTTNRLLLNNIADSMSLEILHIGDTHTHTINLESFNCVKKEGFFLSVYYYFNKNKKMKTYDNLLLRKGLNYYFPLIDWLIDWSIESKLLFHNLISIYSSNKMINCSYFSTNNLIFSSNNDIIQFQKTHIVFFETEHSLQKKQLPRTKNQKIGGLELGDWNWN